MMIKNNLTTGGQGWIWIILAALLPLNLRAKDIYVSQDGGGTTNSVAWLSAPNNWNGTAIAPGDVVHLIGTLTNSIVIGPSGGGAPGNPITLLFDLDAKLSRPTWGQFSAYGSTSALPSDSAIYCSVYAHDLIIDGGSNGIIECTSNGGGGAFTNHCTGINLLARGNVEIKNLAIRNLGVYYGTDLWRPVFPYFTNKNGTTNWSQQDVYNNWPTPGAHVSNENPATFRYMPASTEGIRIQPQASTNLLIHNCTFDMLANAITLSMSAGLANAWAVNTNIQIYSNSFRHFNWGIGWLQSTPFTLCYDAQVWANSFDDNANWNGNPNGRDNLNPNHGDAFILSCSGDGTGPATNYNMRVYRNYFGSNLTTNLSAWLYQETTKDARFWQGLKIYNNIFRRDLPNLTTTSALLSMNGDDVLIANNTFIGTNNAVRSIGPPDHGTISTSSGVGIVANADGARAPRFYNNVVYNLSVAVASWVHLTNPMTNVDYNAYYFVNRPDPGPYPPDGNQAMIWGNQVSGSGLTVWSGWRAMKNDLHGTTNRISFGLNFIPLSSDQTLVGKGTNLVAWGITDDFAGNPRASTGAWTIGAYEVARSTNSLVPPFLKPITPP